MKFAFICRGFRGENFFLFCLHQNVWKFCPVCDIAGGYSLGWYWAIGFFKSCCSQNLFLCETATEIILGLKENVFSTLSLNVWKSPSLFHKRFTNKIATILSFQPTNWCLLLIRVTQIYGVINLIVSLPVLW